MQKKSMTILYSSMVNISKIVGKIENIGIDAFSSVRIKAPAVDETACKEFGTEISKAASNSAASYGKAVVKKVSDRFKADGTLDREWALQRIRKLFSKTKAKDTMTLEEAVKEIDVLPLNEDDKIRYLCACFHNAKGHETEISKPAVYMTKFAILDNGGTPPDKLYNAIFSSLCEDTLTFSDDLFYSFYKNDSWKPYRNAHFKVLSRGKSHLSYINMERKSRIFDILHNSSTQSANRKVSVKTSDIFTTLDDFSEQLSSKLDELTKNETQLPKELVKDMKKALAEYNYDLESVYKGHYSLLKDCKTLGDVKSFYPELVYPTKAEEHYYPNVDFYLRNRLARAENFDASIIEALQKLYVELLPNNKAYVHIDGSTATTVQNLIHAGLNFSKPSDELISFFSECKRIEAVLSKISKQSDETLAPYIKRHAMRTSKVWNDFTQLTATPEWMPVRLIKYKRQDANSKYATSNLVDTYLFSLFVKNPDKKYVRNPFAKFDTRDNADKYIKAIISRIYGIRYKTEDATKPANISNEKWLSILSDFLKFKQQFNTAEMAKSLEHMEDVYYRQFYRQYWTPSRISSLKEQMQKSYDLAYEKIIWGEQARPHKTLNNKDAEEAINLGKNSGNTPAKPKLINETLYSTYKHQLEKITNEKLKERFKSAISQGRESDAKFFIPYANILKSSVTKNGINETKAEALLNLHEAYLTDIAEGTENISEKEFVQKFLSNYKNSEGGYDYARVIADTKAESNYIELSEKLIINGDSEFLTTLEGRYQDDYSGMNEVITKYLATPKEFQEKFRNIYINSSEGCPNVVLERESSDFFSRISSWNFDKDEYIIMDADKIPQKIVLTQEAKKDLWNFTGENYETFDHLIKKLYSSGQKRTGSERGTGIKTFSGKAHEAEIKILGRGGSYRIYADKLTPQDREKYGDDIKYVFKTVVKSH